MGTFPFCSEPPDQPGPTMPRLHGESFSLLRPSHPAGSISLTNRYFRHSNPSVTGPIVNDLGSVSARLKSGTSASLAWQGPYGGDAGCHSPAWQPERSLREAASRKPRIRPWLSHEYLRRNVWQDELELRDKGQRYVPARDHQTEDGRRRQRRPLRLQPWLGKPTPARLLAKRATSGIDHVQTEDQEHRVPGRKLSQRRRSCAGCHVHPGSWQPQILPAAASSATCTTAPNNG